MPAAARGSNALVRALALSSLSPAANRQSSPPRVPIKPVPTPPPPAERAGDEAVYVMHKLLEVATGTGALMEVVAPAFPDLIYQPSEYVPEEAATPAEQWSKHGKIGLRQGLDELANIDEHGCKLFQNCLPAVALDLMKPWPSIVTDAPGSYALVLVSNTLHITPWECSVGLFNGAAKLLSSGGKLVVYGPFKVEGKFVGADGGANNEKFDGKLRSTNESWGIRDVDDLKAVATPLGLILQSQVDMPANNLTLTFVKQ